MNTKSQLDFWTYFKRLLAIKPESLLYRVAVQVCPLQTVIQSHLEAECEAVRLENSLISSPNRPVVVWLDQDFSAPGFGDLLVVIALANFIAATGQQTAFFWSQTGDPLTRDEKAKTIVNFLSPNVARLTAAEAAEATPDEVLFSSRVVGGLDVSVVALQLLNLICPTRSTWHSLTKPIWPKTPQKELGVKKHPVVGIHVRQSSSAGFRNPNDMSTLQDIVRLSRLIPNASFYWFGEETHFATFHGKFEETLQSQGVSLNLQRSIGFTDAALEALSCDFWFQRWGGGIGAALWFSEIPYLMISNDFVLRQVFRIRDRKIVRWASRDQVYDLRWVRSRQKVKGAYVRACSVSAAKMPAFKNTSGPTT